MKPNGPLGVGDDAKPAPGGGAAPPPPLSADAQRALRKAAWHIVPLAMAVLIISNIDRSNLAYAALTFNRDNGFGPRIYSTAVSLFFVTYCVLQTPANLVMLRVGYRPWLTFLAVSWGCVAMCFALVRGAWSLYLLRLLLGVLTTGALPALWHVLSVFFPAARITVPFSAMSISGLVANMVASPIATGLLAMDGLGGLKGWQWLFLLEGAPAVLIGVVVWFYLPPDVASSRFLDAREAAALAAAVDADCAATKGGDTLRGSAALLWRAVSNPYVLTAAVAALMSSIAAQVWMSFMPIIVSNVINGTAVSNTATVAAAAGSKALTPVALTAIPFFFGAVATLLVSMSSQRLNEQCFHVAAVIGGSGALLILLPWVAGANAAAGFAVVVVSLALGAASHPVMMVLTTRLCLGDEQAVALPVVNSMVVLGGVIGPLLTGAILSTLGGFTYVFIIMGCLDICQAIIVVAIKLWVHREGGMPDGGRNPTNKRVQARAARLAAAAAGGATAA